MTAPYFEKKPKALFIAILAIFCPIVYVLSLSFVPVHLVIINQILFFLVPSLVFIQYHKLCNIWDFQNIIQKMVMVILSSLILTHVINIAIAYWTVIFPLPKEYETMYDKLLNKGKTFGVLWDMFQLALVPAICEEFFFRSSLQTSLNHYVKNWGAIVISALIFTLYHFNIWYAPFYFILGLFFGWLFLRKNNLMFPIIAHFINNAYGVILYHYFEKGPY